MIKTITGNWYRSWSIHSEAVERLWNIENYLLRNDFKLRKNYPVRVSTERIILDNEILINTPESNLWDIVTERVAKPNDYCISSLNKLIFNVRNIQPQLNKVIDNRFGYIDIYSPGEIEVYYTKDIENKPLCDLYLSVSTVKPQAYVSYYIGSNHIYSDEKQHLFDWGSTNRLIVRITTNDDNIGKEILKISRVK